MATNGINPVNLNRVESPTVQSSSAPQVSAQPPPENQAVVRQNLPPAGKGVPSQVSTPENKDEIAKAVEQLSSHVQTLNRDLQFSVEEELGMGRTVVKVLDSETKEVIRQIPSEEVIKIAKQLKEMIEANTSSEGLFLEEQV